MSVFLQSVLAVFAAVGFYTVLHTVYEIVSARLLRLHGSAELTLYGDGCDAVSEHLIRAALRVRRQYFPGLLITFVEIGSGQGTEHRQVHGGTAGHNLSGMTSWDGGTLDEREYLIVRGTVQQIVYYNDENGYAVLRLAAEKNGAEVTATGTFPNIGLGEEVILTGCWVTHPTYGEQFATEAFERRLPTSVRGIAEYLGSGLIRGIGPRLAAKIAEKFGEDTFDILMHEPERLSELRGITDRKAKEIGRQFTEQSEMRLLMDFLSEHGLPVALTPLLYKRLHDSAIDALCENPYLLCDPYYDVDFKLADGLAMELGLSLLSDERVDAGILYTLTFNLNNGHTFIPVEKLLYAVCMLLSDDDVVVDEDRRCAALPVWRRRGGWCVSTSQPRRGLSARYARRGGLPCRNARLHGRA